jgi:hypothetical protein
LGRFSIPASEIGLRTSKLLCYLHKDKNSADFNVIINFLDYKIFLVELVNLFFTPTTDGKESMCVNSFKCMYMYYIYVYEYMYMEPNANIYVS